jgi:hypothetical protein
MGRMGRCSTDDVIYEYRDEGSEARKNVGGLCETDGNFAINGDEGVGEDVWREFHHLIVWVEVPGGLLVNPCPGVP